MRKPKRYGRVSLRDQVRIRAGNRCEKCGEKIVRRKDGMHNGSIHHRQPRRMGGPDTISNLVLLCLTCHRDVHKQEWVAAQEGWIVWADPEMTPVHRWTGGWVLLVPDGTFEYLSHQEAERVLTYVNGCEVA